MATLQEIKRRKISVNKTRKITKAMQLVAIAKIRRSRKNLDLIHEYCSTIFDTVQRLMHDIRDVKKLLPDNPSSVTAYIVVTSDLGLCGAYNVNVLRELNKIRRTGDWIYMLGNKGISSAKANNLSLKDEFANLGDKMEYITASNLGEEVLNAYKLGEIGKVEIIYTKFINSMSSQAIRRQILPVTIESIKPTTQEMKLHANIEFEPSPEEIVARLWPLYLSSLIYGAAIESKLSEMSSRRTAMENATENADDLIDQLNIIYNRARQAKITQEINEIVGGAEAMV